jgi:aquaporin Z
MDTTDLRKFVAELLGTAVLVVIGVGVATLSFGFKFTGGSHSAGTVATALAFGLIVVALAYTLGPLTGCHVNPAVTFAFLVSGRMRAGEAIRYFSAQFIGALLGAVVLWAIVSGAPGYSTSTVGLGTNGWGSNSMLGIGVGSAFAVEVVLTFVFTFVVLGTTSRIGSPAAAGLAIGVALACVHLVGIPFTGTSVNPARSLGPALIVGSSALKQVWLFIVAPLVGGAAAALLYRLLYPREEQVPAPDEQPAVVADRQTGRTSATP